MDAQKDEDASPNDIFTVLTLLLDQSDLKDANLVFIEGLFTTDGHEWIPHPNMALNPIERVVDIRNERLLKVLIGYCVNNARKHHPGYLTPVIQCLSKLSVWYPDILSDFFRRASYIPARNLEYVASNAIIDIANPRFSDWVNYRRGLSRISDWINININSNLKSPDIKKNLDTNHYKNAVFSLRTQLPFHSYMSVSYMSVISRAFHLILGGRTTRFQQGKYQNQQPTASPRSNDIYVSPFQFKPISGRNGRQERSFLALIAEKDLSDCPAIVATVQYKWYVTDTVDKYRVVVIPC
jgi:hypothetical protein